MSDVGGPGSGRKRSDEARKTTEDTPRIVVTELFEGRPRDPSELAPRFVWSGPTWEAEFALVPGTRNTYRATMRQFESETDMFIALLKERLEGSDGPSIGDSIAWDVDAAPRTQRVRVLWTNVNFGGIRPWFECPGCGKLSRALYLADQVLACRRCANLTYATQQMSKTDRRRRRMRAIKQQMSRPYVHASTKDRLAAEYTRLMCEEGEYLRRVVAQFAEKVENMEIQAEKLPRRARDTR